ncbi:MAG TPA: hypothetical protein VGM33_19500, partial [Baekduia sp.]
MADIATQPPGEAVAAPPGPMERPEFDIVPLKGLWLVALAFALLIAGILSDKLWPLEFLHVVFGSAWTIIDLFLGLVLGPIMGRMAISS